MVSKLEEWKSIELIIIPSSELWVFQRVYRRPALAWWIPQHGPHGFKSARYTRDKSIWSFFNHKQDILLNMKLNIAVSRGKIKQLMWKNDNVFCAFLGNTVACCILNYTHGSRTVENNQSFFFYPSLGNPVLGWQE